MLGDPASRSADACESYGSMIIKIIKHNTCRRRMTRMGSTNHIRGEKSWKQVFTRGYIEQAFRRCCVSESLLHGEANEPYLQRADWKLKDKGVKQESKAKERMIAPTVRSRVAQDLDAA